MTYTMFIPRWHPPRKNVYNRGSRDLKKRAGVKLSLRRETANVLAAYRYKANVKDAEGKRRIVLTIVLGKRQRGGDPDAYFECLLDAMQDIRLLKQDSRQWVETMPVLYERDWKCWGTRLVIEDIYET